jgi:putative endonuclease
MAGCRFKICIMNYYLYILYSTSVNKYYIGVSNNPEKRLLFHNAGRSGNAKAYTKRATDWEIVYKEMYNTKLEALQRERSVKQKKSRKYIEFITKSIGQ